MNAPAKKDKSLPPMRVETPAGFFRAMVIIGALVIIGGIIICLRK